MSFKKSDITELKRMTFSELNKELAVKRAEAAKTRIAIEMQSEKNHADYRRMRRNIARMQMVLDELGNKPKNISSSDSPVSPVSSALSPSQASKKPVKVTGSKKPKKAASKKIIS